MKQEETVINHNNGLWLRISVFSLIILIGTYIFYRINEPNPNGATFWGLTYGFVGLLAVILLMYYGIRKRRYSSSLGTLKGWLSLHIYIGLLMLIIIPMHAGFTFGLNIHSLSFYLMAIVIISGIFGTYFYVNYPYIFTKYGNELIYENIDEEIEKLATQIMSLSVNKSDLFVKRAKEAINIGIPRKNISWTIIFKKNFDLPSKSTYLSQVEYDLDSLSDKEHEDFKKLSVLSLQKIELQRRFISQIKIKNLLEVWLYFHLPVSIVMMLAIIVHIVSVFYYNGFAILKP